MMSGAFHPLHLQDLKKSGLKDATIAGSGIKTVTPDRIKKALGFDIPGLASLYVIPYGDGFSRFRAFYEDGKTGPKYLQRKDTGCHLYIPPGINGQLNDNTVPLFITEGEKKVLKAAQEGLVCIGLGGLWNWSDGGNLISDFDKVNLEGRQVYIVPDNDYLKPNIHGYKKNLKQAVYRLAERLIERGAEVSIVELPEGPQKGLDDFLLTHTVDDFLLLPKLPVEKCATNSANPLEASVQRLAALPPLEYDRIRRTKAKTLGVRQGTLDAAVKDARRKNDSDDLPFYEVDPWPDPVDPGRLLTDISETIRRFIVCDVEVSHVVALWTAMTWVIDVVQVAPLAVITAPEKRCGKTLLLSLLGKLSARPITASNISPAALFRAIDAWQPTLLIDEVDAFMKDNEELRGLVNSGHTRDSAYVIRTVGENFIPTKFNTWGAKALSGIGHIADTLMDRAVVLELRRKLPHEKVERIRHAEAGLFDELRAKLARFAEDYSETIKQARPPLPDSLNDRAQDNWEPLLAIAMTAGDDWLKRGTLAALKLSGVGSESRTIGTELLSDIQEIIEDKQIDRISTAELIKSLCADEERPWASYNRGKSMTHRQLAKELKKYGIKSKTVRLGSNDTPKGYERHQFEDAFSRYLSPEIIRHTPQNAIEQRNHTSIGEYAIRNISATSTSYPPHATKNDSIVADNPPRCGYENESATPNPSNIKECCVVADTRGEARENNLREGFI